MLSPASSCFNGWYQLHERCCPKSVFGMIFVVVILKNRVDAISQPQKFLHDQNSEKYSAWSMIASAQVIAKSFPFDPFLHRKSHISQGECDSISQIATKTKQMLPFLAINCPTSPSEKYHSCEIGKIRAWNREQPLLIWPLHREITMESGEWILQLKKLEIWIEADASFGSVWLSLSSPH